MLYERLRAATQPLHDRSQNSPFMSRLMNGGMDPESFFDYLGQLKYVYEVLESTPIISKSDFYDRRLERLPLIVDVLYTRKQYVSALPPTLEYADRLKRIIHENDSTLFIAHHYARYMGDLAAGPMFNFISNNLGVDTKYLHFYDFSAIGDPGAVYEYRKNYAHFLDTLISEADYDRFIDEVVWIFDKIDEITSLLANTWVKG